MYQNPPKVLIISHNAFSATLNNGKTYSSIFNGWPKDKIAQLFFQNEIPDFKVCENFFHITDEDMLKFYYNRSGKRIQESDLFSIRKTVSPIHSYVRKKPKAVFNFLRNLIWLSSKWKTANLNEWLDEFEPEAIFFVGGSSSFSYKITKTIADRYNIPVYLYYTDDYITPIKTIDPFWWINFFWLKSSLRKLLTRVETIFVIGEDMGNEYSLKLGKKCIPIMNAVSINEYLKRRVEKDVSETTIELAYFGGLHLNRWKTLLMIGDSIKEINYEEKVRLKLNIYSGKSVEEALLEKFDNHPTICYKGSVTEKEIIDEMQKYDVLVHVESFEKKMVSKTRLSISTKIPEYLASGRVVLGVGPSELSSIKYLERLDFTFTINKFDKKIIKQKLEQMVQQKDIFNEIGLKGIATAKTNHSIENNKNIIKQILSKDIIE